MYSYNLETGMDKAVGALVAELFKKSPILETAAKRGVL